MADFTIEKPAARLDWTFVAESYLDQLSPEERSMVLHVVEQLPAKWDSLDKDRFTLNESTRYVRVGADLRVLVVRQDDVILVIDVVRRSQVEGLRSRIRQVTSAE